VSGDSVPNHPERMSDDAGCPAVEAHGLSVKYQGEGRLALENVDFGLARGKAIAIMGHTGAGKSTFLKCLNGLIPNFQRAEITGSLSVFGLCPSEHGVAELAGKVGIVFQEFENQLFCTNVEQEVAFGPENLGVDPDEIRRRVTECLEVVGLSGFEDREPASLSGGEKQRLAIASVLAMHPDLLLLDETTTDLDPEGRAAVYRVVSQLRILGATVVMIEHEVESLVDFDGIALMQHGRLGSSLSPGQLCGQPDVLSRSGIRPHQVAEACQALGTDELMLGVDDAYKTISHSFVPNHARYEELLKAEREDVMRRRLPLIEVQSLSHSYEKGRFAVQDISLSIGRGDFVALVGRNGSGKTTFVKHLNALLKPTAGKVLLRGKNVSRMRISEVARDVGFVFQNPDNQVFCETIEQEVRFGPENLGYSEKQIERLVTSAIETVDLAAKKSSDPFCLTKGERQRTAIASTLACDPEILILDEPTTGLDYFQERKVMSMLSSLNSQGKTVIFITHSLHLVPEYARRVIAFVKGGIVYDGPVRAFFEPQNRELLAQAGLVPPKIVELSHRFGMTALSVSEFVSLFDKSG